jgi:hypothetical protein
MRSMQICILCMVFAMGILSLHWGNISFDILIADDLTDVYFKRRIVPWEEQALSWRMHLLAVEDAVCGMKRMCSRPYTITHQRALSRFLLQQDDFLRVQYDVLCVRMSCILFMNKQLQPGDKHLRLQFCGWVIHKTVETPQFLCGLTRQYLQVVYTIYVHILHVWATKNPHASRHSSFQHRYRVKLWTGIIDDYVIRPMQYRIISVERRTPTFLKKRFQFDWTMRLTMCAPEHIRGWVKWKP